MIGIQLIGFEWWEADEWPLPVIQPTALYFERFQIDMTATGVRFLPGHRIRVEIAPSGFSRFERNPQTDAANWMTDERPPIVAQQQIHHDAEHVSYGSFLRSPGVSLYGAWRVEICTDPSC